MKLFGPLYERTLRWARHPRAPALLVLLSFAEAIIFPVAPEVMEALSRRTPLDFEYQEMISVEQAEAILIRELGTIHLRRETDPADW